MSRTRLRTHLVRPALPSSHEPSLDLEGLAHLNKALIAGVIILGSGASPNESIEWQSDLREWLIQPGGVMDQALPLLGICYGHQLIAQICGAEIGFLWDGALSKGLRDLTLTKRCLGLPAHVPEQVVVSHREGVFSCPSDWLELSETEIPPPSPMLKSVRAIEAMRHQEYPWWGFQGHIDATPSFLLNNSIMAQLPQPYVGERMIDQFLTYL